MKLQCLVSIDIGSNDILLLIASVINDKKDDPIFNPTCNIRIPNPLMLWIEFFNGILQIFWAAVVLN